MSIFEKASRQKLRFPSSRGVNAISVEELWDLPLTAPHSDRPNLDDIARHLHQQLKESAEATSFVTPSEKTSDELQLKFDVVKHVIGVRVAERDTAAEATKKREQKQRILGLIAEKQDAELAGKSLDELRELAEAL